MKYVRSLDDFKKFTFEFFDSFLPEKLSDALVNYFLLNIGEGDYLINQAVAYTKERPLNLEKTAEYGEAILQLEDYKEMLKKFTTLLLESKSFEQLSMFLNRIFLSQVGSIKYKSTQKDYNISQLYFDRFIEIINYCKIDKSLYQPFFEAIKNCDLNSLMYVYKEPLEEYLSKNFPQKREEIKKEEETTKNQVGENFSREVEEKQDKLKTLITNYLTAKSVNLNDLEREILENKERSYEIICPALSSDTYMIMARAIELCTLLLSLKPARDKLKQIYLSTKDSQIASYLERECGFSTLKTFSSGEEFVDFIEKNVKVIQERLYGVRLKRFYQKFDLNNEGIDGKINTYILEFFKSKETDERLFLIKEHLKYADQDTIERLCWVVYEVANERGKLLSSKWALRLIALYGGVDLIDEMTERLKTWLTNEKTQEGAKYYLKILSLSKREEFVDCIKELKKIKLDKKKQKYLQNLLQDFSNATSTNVEENEDKLVSSLGFDKEGKCYFDLNHKVIYAQINLDCTLTLYNLKTNKPARLKANELYHGVDLRLIIKQLEKKIKEQKKRLKTAFLEFRNYDEKSFKECILNNPLLNFLSQNIVWARYTGDRLVEVCILDDDKLVHYSGTFVMDNYDEYTIAMLQPLDVMENLYDFKMKFKTLFNQFDYPIYFKNIYSDGKVVNNFKDIEVNGKLFITRLQKMKFRVNNMDENLHFSEMYKENKNLNLLTLITFSGVDQNNLDRTIKIEEVKFYDLDKIKKQGKGYRISNESPMKIQDINPHIVSNELALLELAIN